MTRASFQVISLFPEMMSHFFREGVVGQALGRGLIEMEVINPRQFSGDVHHTVDDRPFGGGDGMILLAENLELSLQKARSHQPAARAFYLSPQGRPLTDSKVKELALDPHLILICGRYGGVDQRFLVKNQIEEISIGDYVLSGGELAAAVLIDAVSRQIPGVLGHLESAEKESFSENLLEAPSFTRPRSWQGFEAPEVLLLGNHKKILDWKKQVSRLVTFVKRPDLEPFSGLNPQQRRDLFDFWAQMPLPERKVLGLEALSEADLRRKLLQEN